LTAQNSVLTGALGGRVTDESGAVVPGTKVVVRNLATGVDQSAETNHAGLYRLPAIMPGLYSITATLKGFRDVQVLVRVQVGNTTLQDVKLQVGASANTVKVTGTTPLLRPTESSASTVLAEDSVGRSSGVVPVTLTVFALAPTCSLTSCNVVFPTCTRTKTWTSRKPLR